MTKYIDTLETTRLILRPLLTSDFAAVHEWAKNPKNVRYMAWGPNTEEDTKKFLSSVKPGRDFAVVLKETNKVIGSCGIFPDKDTKNAELGLILHMNYWKKGYGTELAGELIRYGFEDLKLNRLFSPCATINYGSFRVMERNGMVREALNLKTFWARIDKVWINQAVYGIKRKDYLEKSLKTI
jgi:RimJ/RimL family protein N-acetyltransferase